VSIRESLSVAFKSLSDEVVLQYRQRGFVFCLSQRDEYRFQFLKTPIKTREEFGAEPGAGRGPAPQFKHGKMSPICQRSPGCL